MTMPSGYRFVLVGVILAYLAVNLIVGLWAGKMEKKQTTGGFLRNYFIGGRSMGGIVLAMTLIATYTSASSFLSGPGLGSTRGLTQCLVAIIQVGTAFLTLGIIGKKFALISRLRLRLSPCPLQKQHSGDYHVPADGRLFHHQHGGPVRGRRGAVRDALRPSLYGRAADLRRCCHCLLHLWRL